MRRNAYTRSCCPTSSSELAAGLGGTANRVLLAALPFLLLAPLASPVYALPDDADQPIHIRADSAEVDQQAEQVVYRGSVQVNQGTLLVTADEMTIEYEEQKVVRIIARGNPAHYQQQLEDNEEQVKADATTIIYHTRDERIDLRGKASLAQQGNTLTGELILYDIVAGKVDATAGDEAPVRMVLQPARRDALKPQAEPIDADPEG